MGGRFQSKSKSSSLRSASSVALRALVLTVQAPRVLILNFAVPRGWSGRKAFSVPFRVRLGNLYN